MFYHIIYYDSAIEKIMLSDINHKLKYYKNNIGFKGI